MPPPQQPRPKQAQLDGVTAWIASQLEGPAAPTKPVDGPKSAQEKPVFNPGRVTARRLNRTEYNNTIRDLLGVNTFPADDFPQDDSGYGFDNIGDVLSLSPILMEKYISASEKIARTAVFGPAAQKPNLARLHTPERNFKPELTPPAEYDLTGLTTPTSNQTSWRVPVDGEYVIRANLGGERPAGSEAFQLALWIDGKQIEVKNVDPDKVATFAGKGEPQALWAISQQFRAKLEAGDHWLAIAIPHEYEGLPVSYNGPSPSQRPIPPPPVFRAPPGLEDGELEKLKAKFVVDHTRKIPANGARVLHVSVSGVADQRVGAIARNVKETICLRAH